MPSCTLVVVLLLSACTLAGAACEIAVVRQTGTSAECLLNYSYGCTDAQTFWVARGCAALFNCNGVRDIDCESARDATSATGFTNATCACGAPTPAPAPSPAPPPSPPAPPKTAIPKPGAQQRLALSFELEMFVHYSIDTYTDDLDPAKFAPDPAVLNVSQWVATAKAMGARVAALTSKHEKGFCLWPSAYSNFTIAHSPTVGHRDLVREFVQACRAQGVQPGLYFTTTDTYNKDRPDKAAIQTAQMRELTTQYGDDIAYFWFDHHAGTAEWYAIDAIVRANQPQCAMLGPDCWLTGQESGYSAYPMWHGVDTTDNTTHGRPIDADAAHGNPHGTWFKVWESDCSNYPGCHPWFFGGDSPQSLELMMSHWERVYGLGQNYILNMPPSRDGVITPKMAASAAAFGAERHRRYGPGSSDPARRSPCELSRASARLAQWPGPGAGPQPGVAAAASANGNSSTALVLALGGGRPGEAAASAPALTYFDRLWLSEDVANDGQLVGAYAIDACRLPTVALCDAADVRARTAGAASTSTVQSTLAYSCQPGMGESGPGALVGHGAQMSEASCGASCNQTVGCVAFDFCDHVPAGGDSQAACRLYKPNSPRLGPNEDDRLYCTAQPGPGPGPGPGPASKGWVAVVEPGGAKGGQTIGTHHIDVIGNNMTATFVRLRLLQVLDAPTLPMVSFRVLDTRASSA